MSKAKIRQVLPKLATAGQLTWFRENELKSQELIRQALSAKGSAKFAGMTRPLAESVREYIDTLTPQQRTQFARDARRLAQAIRAGESRPFGIPTSAIATSFKAEILDGIHVAGDTYKIALFLAASTIGPATTAYAATSEASGTGYTAGGMNLAGRQVVTDTATVILDWTTDPVWAAATITARGAMIYNSTKANRAIGIFDFGADVASTNGNFTVTLPAPTAAAGAIRIA